jgi:uncharacterized protein (DUF1330 family)
MGAKEHLSPDASVLAQLAAREDDGPVVMLNLLRYEPGGGAQAYGKYAAATQPLIEKHGGKILYVGRAEELLAGEGEGWHAVALVYYPSRSAFLAMVRSEEYRASHHFREEGLAKTVLLATSPITPVPGIS